jgi:hypothetical protein
VTVEDSLHSLLDYECLLFHCDSVGSDLRVGHFGSFRCPLANTPQLSTQSRLQSNWFTNELVDDSSTTESINYLSSFYNFGRTEDRPQSRTVSQLYSVYPLLRMGVFGDPLSSNVLFRLSGVMSQYNKSYGSECYIQVSGKLFIFFPSECFYYSHLFLLCLFVYLSIYFCPHRLIRESTHLIHGAEPFLRSEYLLNWSRNSWLHY